MAVSIVGGAPGAPLTINVNGHELKFNGGNTAVKPTNNVAKPPYKMRKKVYKSCRIAQTTPEQGMYQNPAGSVELTQGGLFRGQAAPGEQSLSASTNAITPSEAQGQENAEAQLPHAASPIPLLQESLVGLEQRLGASEHAQKQQQQIIESLQRENVVLRDEVSRHVDYLDSLHSRVQIVEQVRATQQQKDEADVEL